MCNRSLAHSSVGCAGKQQTLNDDSVIHNNLEPRLDSENLKDVIHHAKRTRFARLCHSMQWRYLCSHEYTIGNKRWKHKVVQEMLFYAFVCSFLVWSSQAFR